MRENLVVLCVLKIFIFLCFFVVFMVLSGFDWLYVILTGFWSFFVLFLFLGLGKSLGAWGGASHGLARCHLGARYLLGFSDGLASEIP